MKKVGRVEIWFSDYWDMPRVFITKWKGKLLLFDAHFDDDLDDYLDHISVYGVTPELAEQLYDIPWDNVARQGRHLGRISVKEVKFPFRLKRWNSEEERIAALRGPVTKAFCKGWMDDEVFKKLGLY